VPISLGSAFEREWAIVHLAPRSSAVLVGRELPPRAGKPGRRFELLWSFDPDVARDAVSLVARLAGSTAPELGAALGRDVDSLPHGRGVDASFATSVMHRTIAHLDRARR
jgi:DICT domain-containing protein